jgi:hypothetical protein
VFDAAVAQHALRADDSEGADRNVFAQAGGGVYDGGGVDQIRHGRNYVKVVKVVKAIFSINIFKEVEKLP